MKTECSSFRIIRTKKKVAVLGFWAAIENAIALSTDAYISADLNITIF